MRIAGFVIGFLGGMIGIPIVFFAMFAAGVATLFGHAAGSDAVLFALAVPIIGMIGAAFSLSKPRIAAVCMTTSALLGLLVMHLFYIFSTAPLLVGAFLVLVYRRRRAARRA